MAGISTIKDMDMTTFARHEVGWVGRGDRVRCPGQSDRTPYPGSDPGHGRGKYTGERNYS